ncbi:thioesterase domain-containing protein [Actinacidiphila guanduensis]|uniref:Phosphopantetheine attachment site n=1 Tax=Actinacidiphila guanduensis TaxID=310781 RepID=A0A1H0BQE6_9ACTN|nr:thioesterase domain-containing protein [Actinacidiphila guanduensis]SDN47879.1 Phosphopantetheine attachment site [Actinacidiphila guanduensis]
MHPKIPDRTALSCLAVEQLVGEVWSARFGRAVTPYDDFFDLGGDSLTVVEVTAELRERGLPVRSSAALRHPTPARLAEHLTPPRPVRPAALDPGPLPAPAPGGGPLRALPIAAGDEGGPLHVVHSESHVRAEREAVAAWAQGRAAFGFPLPGAGGTVEDLAERLLPALRAHPPQGPYRLLGFGHGAVVALEAARRLRAEGAEVALLALLAPPPAADEPTPDAEELLTARLADLAGRFALEGGESAAEVHARFRAAGWYEDAAPADLAALQAGWARLAHAVARYGHPPYEGRALLVADGLGRIPVEAALSGAEARAHRLGHGLRSPLALLRDPGTAETMRKALRP